MEILKPDQTDLAVKYLKQGKVIAYPTEAVFGLGCDPNNIDAVSRILQIKHRALDKGFILLGYFQQVNKHRFGLLAIEIQLRCVLLRIRLQKNYVSNSVDPLFQPAVIKVVIRPRAIFAIFN